MWRHIKKQAAILESILHSQILFVHLSVCFYVFMCKSGQLFYNSHWDLRNKQGQKNYINSGSWEPYSKDWLDSFLAEESR